MNDQYIWTGDLWEAFCQGLLQDRHGPGNIQKVPSKDQGDHGLDYCCKSEATAFQCYAVEGPVTVGVRAKKQKDKIRTDLKKLCDNAAEVAKIFGDVKVGRWVLLVPLHDSKEVNKHASTKAGEVRALALPHISPDFDVLIQDLSAFDADTLSARLAAQQEIALPVAPAHPSQISAFISSRGDLVDTMRGKLAKRAMAGGSNLLSADDRFIAKLIERDNALERLRSVSPTAYEKVALAISRRTERLELIGNSSTSAAPDIFKQEFEQLIQEIKESLPALSKENATSIAYGTLSDWLMRCPLDFPPYGH